MSDVNFLLNAIPSGDPDAPAQIMPLIDNERRS
jgi:hypothetical protein